MKKLTAFVVVLHAVIVTAGCSDETPVAHAPDAAGGASTTGNGGAPASTTASSSTGGHAGRAGSGGAAGAAGAAGQPDAGTGGGGDDGGGDDVSIGPDAQDDAPNIDDGSFPPNATVGSCDPLNWVVSASSSAANNPATNAIDGLRSTRWSTGVGQAPGEYLQIDFGGYVLLSRVTLDSTGSTGDYPRGYEAQTSRDGVDFSNVVASGMSGDEPPVNNLVTIDFAARAVRYLRIQLTASSGSWWSVHELALACQIQNGDGGFTTDQPPNDGLCGPPEAMPGVRPEVILADDGGDATNVADAADDVVDGVAEGSAGAGDSGPVDAAAEAGPIDAGAADANPFDRSHWIVSASNTSANARDAIGHAIDGDITTRWSSGRAQAGNEFFKVDMGSVGCISQVRIVSSGTDFAAAYNVSVSTDDVTYIRVAKGIGTNVLAITFRPRLARFVRIDQVGTSASWWSIDELAILP